MARPKLYELLRSKVPPERIHFGKRVLEAKQYEHEVVIHCQDKSTFTGHIIVGADGAYSAVRQRLYDTLREKGTLPAVDDQELPFTCVCLVGETVPLDPIDFPEVFEDASRFTGIMGGKSDPYSVSVHDFR